jgi:VanZ family protein
MSESTRSRNLHRAIVVLLACYWSGIFIGTHIPLGDLSDLPKHSDKGMHFAAYAGLAFLLAAYLASKRTMTFRRYLLAFVVTLTYAVIDELLQMLTSRQADILDAIADASGSLLGLAAFYVTQRSLQRGAKSKA